MQQLSKTEIEQISGGCACLTDFFSGGMQVVSSLMGQVSQLIPNIAGGFLQTISGLLGSLTGSLAGSGSSTGGASSTTSSSTTSCGCNAGSTPTSTTSASLGATAPALQTSASIGLL